MLDTLTSHRDTGDFNTVPGSWPDPGGFLPAARSGAREAAAHMKDLAERFAELRNAIMRLSGNPSRGERAGLRHKLLHLENTLMSARGTIAYSNGAGIPAIVAPLRARETKSHHDGAYRLGG